MSEIIIQQKWTKLLKDKKLHHILICYNNGKKTIYIDNVKIKECD
jgi:hypothetical protein